MPGFTPGRRWQPPFAAFKHEPLAQRMLASLERTVKGPMFGCRMCGNCLLQETAFICPMECPKGARNGPCGGSTSEHCYVDETRPCIWYKIYERSFAMGREEKLLEVLPPLDWDKVGTETWMDVVDQVRKVGVSKVVSGLVTKIRSSNPSASPIGGTATPNTTRPSISSPFPTSNAASRRVNSWSPPRWLPPSPFRPKS
jgi:hypothetical protein